LKKINKEMKNILVILIVAINLYFPALGLAETIILKSGQKIEGRISEKADKYINVDIEGTAQPYFFEDIESIDGEPVQKNQSLLLNNNNSEEVPRPEENYYYSDKRGDFKIIPPKGFNNVDITGNFTVTFRNTNDPAAGFFVITCLHIPYKELQAKLEEERAREELGYSTVESMVQVPAKFISSQRSKINGIPGWEFIMETTVPELPLKFKILFFYENDKQFTVTFTAKDFDSMENCFKESLATLQIF